MTARGSRATVSLRLLEYAAAFLAVALPIIYQLVRMPSAYGVIGFGLSEGGQLGEMLGYLLPRTLMLLPPSMMLFATFGGIWFAAGYLRRMAEQRNGGNAGQSESTGDGVQEAR